MLHQTRRYKILKHRCTTSSTWEVPMHPISRVSVLYHVNLFFFFQLLRFIITVTSRNGRWNILQIITRIFSFVCISAPFFGLNLQRESQYRCYWVMPPHEVSLEKHITCVPIYTFMAMTCCVYYTCVCLSTHDCVFARVYSNDLLTMAWRCRWLTTQSAIALCFLKY